MQIDASQVLWSAPESERAGRPLLLMLHGHNSHEGVGFDLRHQLPGDLVLASVRAPLRASGGYAWFRLDPAVGIQQANQVARSVVRWLDEMIEAGLPAPPSLGIMGFSQGAATAVQILRTAPTRFDYAVVLSGFVVPGPAPLDEVLRARRTPVFWGRGDADPIIPSYLVSLSRLWLSGHTRLEERVYPGLGHNVAPAELVDLHRFLARHLRPR